MSAFTLPDRPFGVFVTGLLSRWRGWHAGERGRYVLALFLFLLSLFGTGVPAEDAILKV